MGLLSSLIGKKDNEKSNIKITVAETKKTISQMGPKLHLKGKPDTNGLYPAELIMLAVAEKYRITDTKFPGYLTHTYEITNPQKMLKNLQSRGFIEIGSSKDALSNYKLSELKEIASSLGIVVSGKKADIVSQLSEIEEEKLDKFVEERTWKLTEDGNIALKANPYIQYFTEKHLYNIADVGVDIWTVNESFVKNPKVPYRDIIYSQLNDEMNKVSISIQMNAASDSADTWKYCECYRLMGLFIEEEGKSYINAADMYFQYLFKRINIHAGLQLLINYELFKRDKKQRDNAI